MVFQKQSFKNVILKKKKKRITKHAKNYYALTLIYSSMNIKYPLKTSFQTLFFCVRIPYFYEKSPLKNVDVLWGRFEQSFFVFWDVLTNSGTF